MNSGFRLLTKARLRLRSLCLRNHLENELDQELQNHLAFQLEEYMAAGVSKGEARKNALRSMENIDLVKERCRDMRGINLLDDFYSDLRFALRSFRRNPGFAAAAIGILAVGIGSTTAVFSAVDRLLFRSVPFSAPGRLVSLGMTLPFMSHEFLFGSTYLEWQRESRPFESLGSWTGVAGCDLTEDNPVRVNCALIDNHLLPVLGIPLELGRNFTQEEDRPNGPKVALISHAMWQGRFGSDPQVIGKTINVDGTETKVLGVLPTDFELPNMGDADLVLPQALDFGRPPGAPLRVIGRLKPNVTVDQARLQLESLVKQFRETAPPPLRPQIHFVLRSLSDYQTGNVRRSSSLLFCSVLLILLIACANVANLLLARAVSRQREIAVRTALGAGRGRLIRQTLTESLLLSIFGGGLGCGIAGFLLFLFKQLAPSAIPRLGQTALDSRVFLFAAALSVLSGLVFGLVPAFMSVPQEALAGRTTRQTARHQLRQILTASQVALSLVLLMLSAVFLESLWRLGHVALGIDANHVILAQLSLNSSRYSRIFTQERFLADLEVRVRKVPGVTAVATSDTLPPGGFVHTRPIDVLRVPGRSNVERETGQVVAWRTVTPEYFRALGIPLLRGRTFENKDRFGKEVPIVVNQALARRLFGSRNPIGQTIDISAEQVTAATVVGITGDVKNNGPASSPSPEYYMVRKLDRPDGDAQNSLASRTLNASSGAVDLIVRGTAQPNVLEAWVRSAIKESDQTLPVTMSTLQISVNRLSERPRFEAALLSLFGVIALLLAAAGIYGLVSFFVVQRNAEIGVRMALGASPHTILIAMLSQSLRWIISGIAIGFVFTVFALQSVKGLLFDTSALNPLLFCGVALVLILTGIAAAFFPSWRASAIDPVKALRQQ